MGTEVRFGKYLLLRRLAAGGMAEVYLAKETGISGFERAVAIKRMLPRLSHNESFVSMFLSEARIAAQLSHPNIAQIYEFGCEQGSYYLAMEYVQGLDLEEIHELLPGPVPYEHVARILAHVCDALYYAHTRADLEGRPLGIVHRDVSPGNVMLTEQGAVKLVDFGVAKAAAQIEQTRAGVLKGKIPYMSPEQLAQKEIDHRSDLFSVGVMLYELTTGSRPFDGDSPIGVALAIRDGQTPPPARRIAGYPPRLSDIVLRALAKDPGRRYGDARQLQADLEGFIPQTGRKSGSLELSGFAKDMIRLKATLGNKGTANDLGPPATPPGVAYSLRPAADIGKEGTVRMKGDLLDAPIRQPIDSRVFENDPFARAAPDPQFVAPIESTVPMNPPSPEFPEIPTGARPIDPSTLSQPPSSSETPATKSGRFPRSVGSPADGADDLGARTWRRFVIPLGIGAGALVAVGAFLVWKLNRPPTPVVQASPVTTPTPVTNPTPAARTTFAVTLASSPNGADVKIGGRALKTPAKIELDNSRSYTARYSMKGYREVSLPVADDGSGSVRVSATLSRDRSSGRGRSR